MRFPDRAELTSIISGLDPQTSTFHLLYAPPHWPFQGASDSSFDAGSSRSTRRKIHIAVFDSSFNPPTLAHEAIALSGFPPRFHTEHTSPYRDTSSLQSSLVLDGEGGEEYTCRLLLFSMKNVDKTLKPGGGDASVVQRLEMMHLFVARQAELDTSRGPGNPYGSASGDIAIGLVSEPTFAGKAAVIREWLGRTRAPATATETVREEDVKLTFLLGTDTLIRFFEPKYYPGGMSKALDEFFDCGNGIVSVQRGGGGESSEGVEAEILNRDSVKKWVQEGSVRLAGGSSGLGELSSTSVRRAIASQGSVEGRVSDDIAAYIRTEKLYIDNDNA